MMQPEACVAFAQEWIAAWNARDLDRIMLPYADDVHFRSLTAQALLEDGRVEGRDALETYFAKALALIEHLHFELLDIFVGHDSLTIRYRNQLGREGAETFLFNPQGQVSHCVAAYTLADG